MMLLTIGFYKSHLWTLPLLSILFSMSTTTGLSLSTLYQPSHIGPSPLWYSDIMIDHACHLIKTYHSMTDGLQLVPLTLVEKDRFEAAKQLFFLPNCVVVSHGVQCGSEGPILNYGNSAALKRWGASWEELTSMHSIYTAEPVERSVRENLLKQVHEKGIIQEYSGIRIALDQRRFKMINGTIWNLKPAEGLLDNNLIGQAATFSSWEDI